MKVQVVQHLKKKKIDDMGTGPSFSPGHILLSYGVPL